MKANNGKGNTSLRDGWITPQPLFSKLDKQYDFRFDCCADKVNRKCRDFSGDFEKKERISRKITCWMNPPFSKAWPMFKHFFKVVGYGVAIYRCDNLETGIWQRAILPNADWVFVPDKRISYEGLDGSGARFPSALIGVGVDPPKGLEGVTLRVVGTK